MLAGPAMEMEAAAGRLAAAIAFARSLLEPGQQKMPDDIQAALEQAIKSWHAGQTQSAQSMLAQAMEMMKDQALGYV